VSLFLNIVAKIEKLLLSGLSSKLFAVLPVNGKNF